ncbi:GNAT family N-acetyltransferase [Paenibacillus illinoisensis]|uniref:Putative GCN5 N-acetyltransferase n=1 Tax=Paenibacillus illinoisensis TaxID=59845 RepID=A0A2W0CLM9_9BACL|nr:GNAT family protein [Paenibacillus illinoisensis]PYY30972.1 putative GCN5 N-acetyltransferase [Paenibacillus illinoisensis]
MKLDGKKIILSRVTSDDLDFICELECNKDIWFFEEYIEFDMNVVRKEYLQKMDTKFSYDFIVKAIIEGAVKPVGLAQIWSYVEHRKSWELGFATLPIYQGNGFAYEAITLLIKFAFEELEARKVVGMCNCNNLQSVKLMEKRGMRREGTFREELFWNNQWHDQHFYSILESEFHQ